MDTPTTPAAAPTSGPHYAASPHRSGVYHFATELERAEWIGKHDGFALRPGQVDPDVRAAAALHLAEQAQ